MRIRKANTLAGIPAGLALALLAVGGCSSGDGLSKGALAKAIEEDLRADSEPVCWSMTNNSTRWPVNVDFGWRSPAEQPVLVGAAMAGYFEVQPDRGNRWIINLTEKGRDAKVWDEKNGLCIGRRGLHEVVRWTVPSGQAGATFTEVTYTWKLKDVPRWVNPEHFEEVEGLTEPVESSMTLVRTSDGWRSP